MRILKIQIRTSNEVTNRAPTRLPLPNALTIDVEDWYQLANRKLLGRLVPASSRVLTNTYWILDRLAEYGIQATFFILGRVAKQYPDLVRSIIAAGHEIATHGYGHSLVHHLAPETFRTELNQSIRILEDIAQTNILGHRAPEFSLNGNSDWAFEIMAESGLRYDSSVFPIRHPRYGISGAPRHPYILHTKSGEFVEFPLATTSLLGQNFPIAGGGYLRLLPLPLIRNGVRDLNRQGYTAVLYVHPYEFDEDWLDLIHFPFPFSKRMSLRLRAIKRNWGRGYPMRAKFESLLKSFTFAPLSELSSYVPKL